MGWLADLNSSADKGGRDTWQKKLVNPLETINDAGVATDKLIGRGVDKAKGYMSNLASSPGNAIQNAYGQYSNVRGNIANLLAPEGPIDNAIRGPASDNGDPGAHGFHRNVSRQMMEKFAPYIGDNTAIGGLRLIGTGNEVLGGLAALAKGDKFLDPRGFDTGDLMANEQGIDEYLNRNKPKKHPTMPKETFIGPRMGRY